MSVIRGRNVILYFEDEGEMKPLACGQNISLVTNTDTAETATIETGTWRTIRGMRNNWTVACDGLVSFDMNMTVTKLRTYQFAFTPVFISFTATDDNGIVENYQGYIIVVSVDTNAAHNSLYKYSMSGEGTGQLTITDTPFDPNENNCRVMYYFYDGTGTETNGNTLPAIADLDGKVIDILFRDGVEHRKVTDTEPTGKQFKLNPDDATQIIFAEDLPPIQLGEAIDIQYQNP